MLGISLGGLIGAVAGTIVAAAVYGSLIDFIEGRIRAAHTRTAESDAVAQQEIVFLRHGVFAFAVLGLGGLGYWIGDMIGG